MVYPRKDKIKQCIDFYFEIHKVLFWWMTDVKIHKKTVCGKNPILRRPWHLFSSRKSHLDISKFLFSNLNIMPKIDVVIMLQGFLRNKRLSFLTNCGRDVGRGHITLIPWQIIGTSVFDNEQTTQIRI